LKDTSVISALEVFTFLCRVCRGLNSLKRGEILRGLLWQAVSRPSFTDCVILTNSVVGVCLEKFVGPEMSIKLPAKGSQTPAVGLHCELAVPVHTLKSMHPGTQGSAGGVEVFCQKFVCISDIVRMCFIS
jgi:hypothetical protein